MTVRPGDEDPAYAVGGLIAHRYRVYRQVSGGIGDVYFCVDEKSGLPLAIKCLREKYIARPDKHRNLRRRFDAEALIWAALDRHPNIVRCHYLTTDGPRRLLCMEWVTDPERREVGLGRLIKKRGRLPLRTALEIAAGVCRGLLYLQERHEGFVHRDLKPENVLIAHDGTPKITDFGFSLLRANQRLQASSAVADSSIVGTPHYMSPEQWRSGLVDDRADVYALGLILFEMLDGGRAFAAKERAEWRRAHRHEQPRPLPEDVSEAARALVAKCLLKEPNARYGSVADLMEAINAVHLAEFGEPLPEPAGVATATAQDMNNRGNTLYHLGLFEEALAAYYEAIESDPELPHSHAGRGLALHSLGRTEEALAAYDLALDLAPGLASAHANRAKLLEELGDVGAALDGYGKAIELDPGLGVALVNRGEMRRRAGDSAGALADFGAAIAAGGPREAFLNRSVVYAEAGETALAVADLEALASSERLNAEEERRLGDLLVVTGRFRDAVAAFTRAMAEGGPPVDLHRARSSAYARAKRTSDALEDLNAAIRLDSEDGASYRQRGALYRDLGLYDEALADYGKAALLNEDDPRPYYEMALVLGYRGDYEPARRLLEASAARGSLEARGAQRALEARERALIGLGKLGRRNR